MPGDYDPVTEINSKASVQALIMSHGGNIKERLDKHKDPNIYIVADG